MQIKLKVEWRLKLKQDIMSGFSYLKQQNCFQALKIKQPRIKTVKNVPHLEII